MNKEIQEILNSNEGKLLLIPSKTKKHRTIKHEMYLKLERLVVDEYFSRHPEINRKNWSAWSIATDLKDTLKLEIKKLAIIVLNPSEIELIHPYQSKKVGIKRVTAIEKKIKLQQKLKDLQENRSLPII